MRSTEGLEGGRCMLKTSAIRDDNNRFLFTYAHCLNCVLLQGVWAPFKCKYFTREYHMGDTAVCFYQKKNPFISQRYLKKKKKSPTRGYTPKLELS